MDIGKAMKSLREESGKSRETMAKELGVGRASIWKIESNKHVPKYATIVKFCERLEVPLARFFMLCMEPEDFK